MINKKRVRALLLAGVMTMTMVLGGSSMAADGEGENDQITTTVQPMVTKVLEMAEGITVPDAAFSFEISSNTPDASRAQIQDITYSSADEKGTPADGKYCISKTSEIDFDSFEHAGVYEYTVTEKADTYLAQEDEVMTYSASSYKLNVYVVNSESGPCISEITATKDGVKVDKIEFVNTFVKNNKTLTISKSTVGDYADKTKDFTFTITFTKAATAGDETSYTGTIGDTTVVCEAGVATEFSLHDGEELVFTDLPAGTRYVVTEAGAEDGYTPSVNVVENGTETVKNATVENEKDALSSAETGKTNLVGECENKADFVNTYKSVVITGIIVNVLPFVVMIAAVLLAAAGLAVVKRRRSFR